ncbi:acyltransferase family protein [Fretibacter rubidus]|uniref:acyltransferase family protein n=1 Tax=Fretibacter rubidus TaxID=570162 RepID=UPI00352AAAC3
MTQTVAQNGQGSKPASPYNHGEYFGALDGFRGVLALLVAVYHTPWESWFNNTPFMDQGTVLIDLFFVFSGFLMFRLYGDKIHDVGAGRAFMVKRIARLYPIHFVMTMMFLAFALARILAHKIGLSTQEAGEVLPFAAGAPENIWSLLSNLTLTQAMGLHDSLTFNPPSWTISVEFFAYFVFIAMLIWAPPKRAFHFGLIGAGVAGLYVFLASQKPNMDITHDLAFWRCLAGFFTGVIGARIYGIVIKDKSLNSVNSMSYTNILECAALLIYLLFVGYCGGKMQFLVGPVALLFVVVFAQDKGFISRLMMRPVFGYLAKISYSVYMIHVIIAIVFDMFGGRALSRIFGAGWHDTAVWGDLYILPYLLVVIGCAHLSVIYIERPGARLINHIFTRPKLASARQTG